MGGINKERKVIIQKKSNLYTDSHKYTSIRKDFA